MINFLKSTEADFQKLAQQILTIHKNVLYITYQVDFIRKRLLALETDKGLQKQVDEFYEYEGRPTPEEAADLD